jgi:hypothetical protein
MNSLHESSIPEQRRLRRQREAQARAEIAVLALGQARKASDLTE